MMIEMRKLNLKFYEMRRFVVVLLFCFAFANLFSQKVPTKKEQKAQQVTALQASALKNEGNKALAIKDYKTALAKYESAMAIWGNQPADYAMIYSMGTSAYSLNDMPKAQKYFDMCIAAGQNLDMAYQYKGCVMQARKDTVGYVKILQEGLAKVPKSTAMKSSLSKYYDAEGDKHYHKAIEILKNATGQVKAGKYTSSDNAFKAENEKARKELNDALKLYNTCLELTPNEEHTKKSKSNCVTQLQMLI
jgi:tetratricopeptide (TPR) repeat protein